MTARMTLQAPARPELAAHERAVRLDFRGLARETIRVLGQTNAARVASVSETRAVREWAMGDRGPRDPRIEERLRFALLVAYMLEQFDSPGIIRAWFTGLNPRLSDRQPLEVIRTQDLQEAGPRVLAAARSFIAHG